MSRFRYNQETAWTWSVVLLSTLLLSPVASVSLRHALMESLPVSQREMPPPSQESVRLSPQESRRLEEAIRAAQGKPVVLRWNAASEMFALVLIRCCAAPSPRILSAASVVPLPPGLPVVVPSARRAAPPRAPPV